MVSFAIILIIVYIAGVYIASRLSKINKVTKTIDKLFGTLFGILKGLIVVSLILIFLKSFNFISEDTVKASVLYPYVYDTAPKTYNAITDIVPISKKSFEDLNPLMKKDTVIRK